MVRGRGAAIGPVSPIGDQTAFWRIQSAMRSMPPVVSSWECGQAGPSTSTETSAGLPVGVLAEVRRARVPQAGAGRGRRSVADHEHVRATDPLDLDLPGLQPGDRGRVDRTGRAPARDAQDGSGLGRRRAQRQRRDRRDRRGELASATSTRDACRTWVTATSKPTVVWVRSVRPTVALVAYGVAPLTRLPRASWKQWPAGDDPLRRDEGGRTRAVVRGAVGARDAGHR
jgi:hypothetical protein